MENRANCYTWNTKLTWVIPVVFLCLNLNAGNAPFYIWHRNWKSPNLIQAVKANKSSDYYFISREFHHRKIERVVLPESWWRLPNRKVPVFRIRNAYFKKYLGQPETLAEVIVNEYQKVKGEKKRVKELQIDLDCPESKLKAYAVLLAKLKKRLPKGDILSFTCLPCHVGKKDFREVTQAADYYVLQVHGLEFPKTLDDKVEILNLKVAERAIALAEKGTLPFYVALPTYAYQLNFNRENKKFLFLNSEKIPPPKPEVVSRIIVPDLKNLTLLANKKRSAKCLGIIWFKLPVKGDQFNLDMNTINQISRDVAPEPHLTYQWEKKQNGLLQLSIKNHGMLNPGNANIKLNWPTKAGVYDLYRDFRETENQGLTLPEKIKGKSPNPGMQYAVGWFRPDKNGIPDTSIVWGKDNE